MMPSLLLAIRKALFDCTNDGLCQEPIGCVGHYSNNWFLAWISVVSSGRKPISRKTSTLSGVWDSRRRLKMQNKWLRDRKSQSITCELYDFGRHLTCVQGAPSPIFFWGATTWELFTVTLGALCIADLGNKGEWSLSRSGCYVLFGGGLGCTVRKD